MTYLSEHHFRTGGDPRTFTDHALLRDELSKLTHPARPDVNWQHAEKCCLSLFEHNGIELQGAAWYTLTRTHIAGLSGLNDGLSILETLITRQWESMWPQQARARINVLSALSKRLRQHLRTLTLVYADLDALYQAEKHLNALDRVLQRAELTPLNQFEMLRTLVKTSVVRLENNDTKVGNGTLPPTGITSSVETQKVEPTVSVKELSVEQPERQSYPLSLPPKGDMHTGQALPGKFWKPFIAGAFCMLVAGSVALWGWQTLSQPDPEQVQLAASLAQLPETLSAEQLQALQQKSLSPENGVRDTQRQLVRLARLPPDWSTRYGDQLVQQALTLWPQQAKPLAEQWRQQQNATAFPVEKRNGWYQGMLQLQQLTHRLNALDEKRGKYMTVSELKSEVFTIIQSFNRAVPVEEQLRQLAQIPPEQPLPVSQVMQVETSLGALLSLYSQTVTRIPRKDLME